MWGFGGGSPDDAAAKTNKMVNGFFAGVGTTVKDLHKHLPGEGAHDVVMKGADGRPVHVEEVDRPRSAGGGRAAVRRAVNLQLDQVHDDGPEIASPLGESQRRTGSAPRPGRGPPSSNRPGSQRAAPSSTRADAGPTTRSQVKATGVAAGGGGALKREVEDLRTQVRRLENLVAQQADAMRKLEARFNRSLMTADASSTGGKSVQLRSEIEC